jgi:hypothetical protein
VKKITKWGIGLVMTLAMMFMAGQASAVTLGMYDTGQLVPTVYHDGACINTVVGLQCVRNGGCHVYWTFFDVDSTHITDGYIRMTDNDYYPFSWMDEAGYGLDGVDGYLVFTSGTGATDASPDASATNDIFASAFMVNAAGNDAVFIPVVPLELRDYDPSADIRAMDATSIISLTAGTAPGQVLDIRYWIDPAYSASTAVVLWSVCDVWGTYTVNMFNDTEQWKSLNFDLPNEELNIMDPSILLGRPCGFIDGFIRFIVPSDSHRNVWCGGAERQNDMFVFSYVDSDLIGAMQTMLAGEQNAGVGAPGNPPCQ